MDLPQLTKVSLRLLYPFRENDGLGLNECLLGLPLLFSLMRVEKLERGGENIEQSYETLSIPVNSSSF